MVSEIEVVTNNDLRAPIEDRMVVKTSVVVLMNFDVDFLSDYVETINALQGMVSHSYSPKKLDLDLKQLPSHLLYVSLGTNNTLPMILDANLNEGRYKM